MSDALNGRPESPAPVLETESAPHTPNTDKRRSRFDQFNSPQSPMIKITEEEGFHDHTVLGPPPLASNQNKRWSAQLTNTPLLPPTGLYSLGNNSSSSLLSSGNVPGNRSSISNFKYTPQPSAPSRNRSPARTRSPARGISPERRRSPSPKKYSPFNFKSTNLTATPANNARASHRKGHRYKHSSVSMNLFQEPKKRAPLTIPTAFPVPTSREFFSSCTKEQKLKLGWSLFHLSVALLIFLIGFRNSLHSFSTLSHLMFYDSLACLAVVFVDIMGNFDVWSKSSIKYPFGLGRIEVLFGFALSVSLIFVGCDLVSHLIEELMFSFFDSEAGAHDHTSGHNQHAAEGNHSHDINTLLYETTVLFVIATTLISSKFISGSSKNSVNLITSLSALKQTIISNPTHFITALFATYLSIYPFISSLDSDLKINQISTLFISLLICYMGWKVVKYLGLIVLLSFPSMNNEESILNKIRQDIMDLDMFKSTYQIQNLIVSKVHINLVIVLINIKMIGGSDEDEVRLRYEITSILKTALERETIQTTIDIDRI